jgi:hypothetical protein
VTPARRPAYACALAYALRATSDAPVSRVDLRKGDMAFAGQLQNLRRRLPAIAVGAAVMLALAGVNVAVRYHLAAQREAAVDEQFCAITQEVVGRRICEPAIALSVLRQPASELGSFKIPEKSAYRVAAELSHLSPKDVEVTLTEVDLRPDKARIVGTTASFDAVDQIVGAYAEDACMENIRKGNLNKRPDGTGVDFQLTADLRCSQ